MTAKTPSLEPLGIPVSDLHRYGGPSRAVAFQHLATGKLEGYRVGRARMVTYSSLKRLIAEAAEADRAARHLPGSTPAVSS